MPVSTRVADMGAGGGIIEDTDAVILQARYILSNERPDYQKSIKDGKIQLILALQIMPFTQDGYGKVTEQLWTGGEASRLMPTPDGLFIDLAPGAPPSTRLIISSNIGQLYESWERHDPQTDREQPGIGISVLEGFIVHFLRVKVKGRENMAVNLPGQTKKEPDVLLVSKIHGKDPARLAQLRALVASQAASPAATPAAPQAPALPTMQAPAVAVAPAPVVAMPAPSLPGPALPGPALAPTPTAPAAPSGLDSAGLQEIVMGLVAAGPIPKAALANKAFAAVQAKWPTQRNDYLRLLVSEEFLKSAPVNYDGTTVSALG